jgi:hypothetical protein|nr:MAG TPA: hypothetical protein [Caudoviricetes sp.]
MKTNKLQVFLDNIKSIINTKNKEIEKAEMYLIIDKITNNEKELISITLDLIEIEKMRVYKLYEIYNKYKNKLEEIEDEL